MTIPIPAIAAAEPVGSLLRHWRRERRLSQLDLSVDAGISTRHLSFLETGRAQPSREMLLRLVERLDVPLRERNPLFVAAGYAPPYRERPLEDPGLQAVRDAVQRVLRAHEPFPALAVDRHWNLVLANAAVAPLLAGCGAALLAEPVNVLRLSLHPDGLAPRIVNLAQWREHLLARLQRQVAASGDPALVRLARELQQLPAPEVSGHEDTLGGVAVPLRLHTPAGVLSFISTVTVFGTPLDIAVSELALESFFPADEFTAQALRAAMSAPTGADRTLA